MARTSSMTASIRAHASGKHSAPSWRGQLARMTVSSWPGSFWYSSSVKNGMNGCSSFIACKSTNTSTLAAARRSPSPPRRRGLAISIYQSQNSNQMKSYTFCAARPSSKASRLALTCAVTSLRRCRIHRSASSSAHSAGAAVSTPSMLMSTKRAALYTLLQKLRAASTFSQ